MFTTLNSKLKRMLSVVLALSMVLSPIMALAEEVGEAVATALEEPVAVVFAASDFQPRRIATEKDTNGAIKYADDRFITYGINEMEKIADAVKKDYKNITGALFGGDYSNESKYRHDYAYSNNANVTIDGINAVKYVFGQQFGLSQEEIVMIQGNHDFYRSPLATTNAHDTEDYGVYAISEKDFMYQQAHMANGFDTIQKTAEELDRYLQAKVAQHYSKPIFIVNHIPLHHNPRAEDNRYAEYLFDVINKAGEQGLNIIYLFGHNHSAGYDAHIGEAAIYLKPGESIYIPIATTYDATAKICDGQKRTLNFTYMNAGYVGYVTTNSEGFADNTLTSTVFAIYENRVEIKRYDAKGKHVLKAAGISLSAYATSHLHVYPNVVDENGDVLRLDDKFNVSLNIDKLYYPKTSVKSDVITEIKLNETPKEGTDYVTTSGDQKISIIKSSQKTVSIPVAENFKVGSTGQIGINYVAEQYKIKSATSSKPGVATVSEPVNGEVTVTGVAPGETTLTIVAEHVGGVYGDVSLAYDLVVFPADTIELPYTRYQLVNAIQPNKLSSNISASVYTTSWYVNAKELDNKLLFGESYIFVDKHHYVTPVKNSDGKNIPAEETWAYAFLNTSNDANKMTGYDKRTFRNVAAYGGGSTNDYTGDAQTVKVYSNTYIDISDEYMEWIYCDGGYSKRYSNGGYIRNSATGLFLTSNKSSTTGNFSMTDVCPKDTDDSGDSADDDFNVWKIGRHGLYIDTVVPQASGSYDKRRFMRFELDSAYTATNKQIKNSMFRTEITNNQTNGYEEYSNVSIYKKVKYGNDLTGETAWLDTKTISAFAGDLDGVTGATMYVSDGINVTPVPVTVNMLYSDSKLVTKDLKTDEVVASDFVLKYDTEKIGEGITLTMRQAPKWDNLPNASIFVGDTHSVAQEVQMPKATKVTYTYESLNVACATVSSEGIVTGTGVGGANIRITATATYADGSTLSTSDEVYITVKPVNTCCQILRDYGKNNVYVLVNNFDKETYNFSTGKYSTADEIMIVSADEAGEAFAMQRYLGTSHNLNAAPVTIESYNGKIFIQDIEDKTLLWKMSQNNDFFKKSKVFSTGSGNDTNGLNAPSVNYYLLDGIAYTGLDFVAALQNLNNNAYDGSSLTLDCGTGMFLAPGKASYIEDAVNNDYPEVNGSGQTDYDYPASGWMFLKNLGFAAANYNPRYAANTITEGYSGHFPENDGKFRNYSYVLTYDETMKQFKTVFHNGTWPSNVDTAYANGYPGRVYAYTKEEIETSGVMIWVSGKVGNVGYNAEYGTPTGATVNITTHGPNGSSTVSYPLTFGMLSGTENNLPTDKDETYTNLNVKFTYNNTEYTVCNQFTLNVKDMSEDYPDYPNQGSVNTNKTLDTSRYPYKATGVSHIDLTVSGVPLTSGIDIVVMIDASTSMQSPPNGVENGEPRLKMLYRALAELMDSLKQPDENGKYSDVDFCIASFNGQTYLSEEHIMSPLQPLCPCEKCTNAKPSYHYYNSIDRSTVNLPFVDITDPSYDAFINGLNNDIKKCYFGKDDEANGKICNVNMIKPAAGTNYDKAMDLTYDLLTAKQAQNAARGENRKQYVLFMTDGETWQYNYFGGRNMNKDPNGHTTVPYHDKKHIAKWLYVLDGRLTDKQQPFAATDNLADTNWNKATGDTTAIVEGDTNQDLFRKYYNPEGKHWMAEAIKGDPSKPYMIIDPDSTKADKIEYVNGLGATMYTIAFAIGHEPKRGLDSGIIENVVKRMASSEDKFTAISPELGGDAAYQELLKAFMEIKNETKSSGSAMYTDQMGDDFDLQMKPVSVGDEEVDPSITLTSYPLYRYWEVGTVVDGVKVSQNMVGKRKSNAATLIEKISFNDTGTVATSSLLGNESILGSDGIIRGKNVWYNTNSSAYTVTEDDAVRAPSLKGKILEPETFYWMIGDVPEDEYVLGYDIYLEGSMEGDGRAHAGLHDTNNFATLTYINHLGTACTKDVPTPKLPWEKAYVGVGFYFVNDNGQPLVNRKTGQTGSFEAAQKLPDVVYYDFALNSGQMVDKKVIASQQLPGGYVLYDEAAEYEVFAASSNELDQHWKITKGDVSVATTYVTQIGSVATSSNKLEEHGDEYTYTNTIVYFAIYGNVDAVDDTVVVDYALDVYINVMANDILFMGEANLVAVSPELAPTGLDDNEEDRGTYQPAYVKDDGETPKRGVNTKYGAANITSSDNPSIPEDEIRYTVKGKDHGGVSANKSMQFDQKDVFSYAAKYTGDSAVQGYYYANVTVIPATIVYYEEDFVDFKVFELEQNPTTYALTRKPTPVSTGVSAYNKDHNDEYKMTHWFYSRGTKVYTQAQDRPGHLTQNDKNNIYGFDDAYLADSSAQYSRNNAAILNLKPDDAFKDRVGRGLGKYEGEASFSFYGTGFDVISASANDTGTVVVRVYPVDANGVEAAKPVKTLLVDTYYGYSYNAGTGEWVSTTTSDDKTMIYQIPIIKVSGLNYGNYKVYITVSYSELFDHITATKEDEIKKQKGYMFILDSIRIYDPVKNNPSDETIKNAYINDKEYLPVYKEVRDILISADTFNSLENSSVNGSVFIDDYLKTSNGNLVHKDYTISDYTSYGPNNEVYLIKGQAIAFNLNAVNASAVHLAMKTVTSGFVDADNVDVGVSARIYNAKMVNGNVVISNEKTINIKTSSDLYYDISKLNGGIVVIENITTATETYKKPAILSLTNLKFTYADTDKRDADIAAGITTISKQTAKTAVAAMKKTSMPWLDVDVEESAAFTPEQFDVVLSKTTVKQGGTVTVTVNTSADVDHITINGVEVTKYTKSWFTAERQWKYTFNIDEAGNTPIVVVAYNADGEASDELTNTVSATERVNLVSTANGSMLDRMYSGWVEKLSAKAN